jgi:Flp pilus assembly protein TadB
MPEEPRPSIQPHGQRRSDGAPAWWSLLDRGDLPDDGSEPISQAVVATPPAQQTPRAARRASARSRLVHLSRNWLVNIAALLVALLVVMLGVGVDSARGAVIVALIFGVPMLLVAVIATVAARRAR